MGCWVFTAPKVHVLSIIFELREMGHLGSGANKMVQFMDCVLQQRIWLCGRESIAADRAYLSRTLGHYHEPRRAASLFNVNISTLQTIVTLARKRAEKGRYQRYRMS